MVFRSLWQCGGVAVGGERWREGSVGGDGVLWLLLLMLLLLCY